MVQVTTTIICSFCVSVCCTDVHILLPKMNAMRPMHILTGSDIYPNFIKRPLNVIKYNQTSSNVIKFDGSLVSKTTTGRIMYIIGADKLKSTY